MLCVMEFCWRLQIIAKGPHLMHAEGQKTAALCLKLLQKASAKEGWVSHFATGFLCDLEQFTLAWILEGFDHTAAFRVCGNEVPKCSRVADPECPVLPMSTNYCSVLSARWLPVQRALRDLPAVPQRPFKTWRFRLGIFLGIVRNSFTVQLFWQTIYQYAKQRTY